MMNTIMINPTTTHEAAVLAVKHLDAAKSRLGDEVGSLVLAMLLDTIEAIRAAGIGHIIVVSPDPRVREAVAAAGCLSLDEGVAPTAEHARSPHGTGLNRAMGHGISEIIRRVPDVDRIVAVQADLPAASGVGLRAIIDAAHGHREAFLADSDGRGTAVLIRDADVEAPTRFGPESAAAHRDSGAVEIDPERRRWAAERTDVDTPADLAAATELGLGRHTCDILAAPSPVSHLTTSGIGSPHSTP